MKVSLLILGAGPTGLGAAWRLQELKAADWQLVEASSHAGGLASSFVDDKGFTWDIGGHVQFSHYAYFDQVMDDLLGKDGWLQHQRESWVWMRNRFIPYPFQYNIHQLPPEDLDRCLAGLVDALRNPKDRVNTFREWIDAQFGSGIADVFMCPYNFKVWAFPPEMMNAGWVGERVAAVDLKRVLNNLVFNKPDISWGPNRTFRFPRRGGTGAIWRKCAERLPSEKLSLGDAVVGIDLKARTVRLRSGQTVQYHNLISTLSLDQLIRLTGQDQFTALAQKGLLFSSSNIFGIGLKGQPPEALKTKCWMYFPENNCPFYRVTVFSNYSPNNVPNPGQEWSLMAEVSESSHKPENQATMLESVIQGMLNTQLIRDRSEIVSTWKYRAEWGYPTPGLHRDAALNEILPFFEQHGIFSRGRFGAWKYEVSNQDHSFMQGVECVERLLNGKPELTLNDANGINSKYHPWPFERWTQPA
ncbi:MAG TPA: FAD-dependent oxidoreductase [Desulfuromonadaceae bacterium]|nr:FAD-dependent oxidoreductase [Desulfuromonadaceae bacterium]